MTKGLRFILYHVVLTELELCSSPHGSSKVAYQLGFHITGSHSKGSPNDEMAVENRITRKRLVSEIQFLLLPVELQKCFRKLIQTPHMYNLQRLN